MYTNSQFTVDCVGTAATVDGPGAGLEVAIDGTGTGLTLGVVGTGTTGFVLGTGGIGIVGVGTGGPRIVVGPPTGPEQISPISQHPIMSLLAREQ